jgi:chromosome segregation ATPase
VSVFDKGVKVEYQEALNVLEAVKSRYQAFDKLEEVARVLASQDQHMKEMKEQAAELDRQLVSKRRTMKALEERTFELEALMKNYQETYSVEQIKWESAVRDEQNKYNQLVDDLELAHKNVMKEQEDEYAARKRALSSDVQELEQKKTVLEQQIVEIKSRIGGL